jgi:uncharacterized membrane protein
MSSETLGLMLSVVLASAVEFVEALTIVLAMGVTRGWRSTLAGVAVALAALAAATVAAGYALESWLPEALLQLVIGTLLLIFGLQWLRKAILRAAGLKARNDEDETYREELEAGRRAGADQRFGLDWFGFVVSFKGVFLEGLEIVFIVITFGLQWLRKAILRAAGLKARNDEDETYREELEAGRRAGADQRFGLDWFGFVVSFKGVFLEGLEIVFIVITFGLNADDVPAAAAGAALAGVVVLGIGAVAHKPLASVPQNTIKFAVGLLLSTFGTFWAVEGLGVFADGSESLAWPGGDAALLALLAIWAGFAWTAIRLLRPAARAAAEGA